jgi:cytochrome P450
LRSRLRRWSILAGGGIRVPRWPNVPHTTQTTHTPDTAPTHTPLAQGDIVAASPNFSHVLPTVFSDPTAYDPERFAAPREEDKKKPFSFIGFGGGRHACIGQNFAYLQIKAIWAVLLR